MNALAEVELASVTTAVAEFDKVAAGLAELRQKFNGVVFDVTTADGMDAAKSARLAIRQPRYEVERIRKSAKAPLLALGKKLDSEAARITDELLKLENPIDAQVKTREAQIEAERQAKVAAELARVARLQERVAALRGNRMLSASSGSALIAEHIAELEGITVDASFEEFEPAAVEAKADGLAWLHGLHAAAVAHEAEQKRLAEERAEFARLKAEEAKRQAEERARIAEEQRKAKEAADVEAQRLAAQKAAQEAEARQERERIAEEERQAKAARDAETQRHAEQLKAQREEQERAQRERQAIIDAENERKRQEQEAEAARLAAKAAEIERQEAGLRKTQELPSVPVPVTVTETLTSIGASEVQSGLIVDPKADARVTFARPSDDEIITVLVEHFGVPRQTVLDWLCEMDLSTAEVA